MAGHSSLPNDLTAAQLVLRSRRSSQASAHDIFGDEHVLQSASTSNGASPISTVPLASGSISQTPTSQEAPQITSYPQIPGSQSNLDTYLQKRQMSNDDGPVANGSQLDRSGSTSTRFSIPRSQSPYTGPTVPSHPYAMYPQVTRASSVASESTIRPQPETPFVPRGGPEHPYSLYPQNTVPEEDEDITAGGIPLGFSSTAGFSSHNNSSNSDDGDIVGRDGHIEQLPPYTRYADNTVAKGNMENIQGTAATEQSDTSSREAPSHPASTTASTAPLQPAESFDIEGEEARKEGWKEKAQKRMCGGMPLWCLVLIVVVIIIAATLGGVIGGVIGNRQGADRVLANITPTTVWLDAVPTTLGPNAPTLPTGNYTIPFKQSQEVSNCIANSTYDAAWGCLDYAYIGVRIQRPNPNAPMQAIFEDYSVNTADFRYGPQPPDFNGTAFDLLPFIDKDEEDAAEHGVAMFFSVPFDKLSIIPEKAIPANNANYKRSIAGTEIAKRETYTGKLLRGDKPWFCFWNSTINEFWVYLEQKNYSATDTSTTITDTSTTTSDSGGVITPAPPLATTTGSTQGTQGSGSSSTTFAAYNPTPTHHNGYRRRKKTAEITKRAYTTKTPFMPDDYPRLIKMVEKRQPSANIPPYCQKMEVCPDFSIVPLEDVEPVFIEELEWTPDGLAPWNGVNRRKRDEDVQIELESNCICEWLSVDR